MDELEDDENGPDNDVAALMGFGTFGDQHRGKRRRYNGRAEDAVVDGGPSPSGRKKERGSGSGSNYLPLGTGRSRREKSDGSTAETTSVGTEITTKAKTRTSGTGGEGTGDEGGDGMESIAVLHAASRQAEQTRSSSDMLPPTQPSATTGPSDTSLPPKPPRPVLSQPENAAPASATGTGKGMGKGTGNEAWKLRKGIKLANGEIAYYEASFVEDPWREWR